MGGEITVQDLGSQRYQVTLIAYRDTVGVPIVALASLDFYGPQNQYFSSSVAYDTIISGNRLPMYPYGVEVYLYTDTVTLPAYGRWDITWTNCCRNSAIQNLATPLTDAMTLQTSIVTDSLAPNSSPYFLVPAAIFLPLNTPWQYNPLPFDTDGDSLHWSIDQPLKGVNQYCAGYVNPPSDTSNPFRIDPLTGTLSWTANSLGNFVASVLVSQYRNGKWVGEIRRDMQFIVITAHHGFPTWTNLHSIPVDSNQNFSLNLEAGKPFNLEILAKHTDSTRNVYLGAFSEIFGLTQSNASFIQTKNSGSAKGKLSWQPTQTDIRKEPYKVVLRLSDNFFTDDKVVLLTVSKTIGLEEKPIMPDVSLYPNPAKDVLFINVQNTQSQKIGISVYALNGTRVHYSNEIQSNGASNLYALGVEHFAKGAYVVKITGSEGLSISKMVMID